ncbi:MAG TPA: hypothetical protein VK093_00220 [Candidatus Avipropionibacterium sp.]|nr:hypothetical protein [Candidatus Avipropionibacterium sp.]
MSFTFSECTTFSTLFLLVTAPLPLGMGKELINPFSMTFNILFEQL